MIRFGTTGRVRRLLRPILMTGAVIVVLVTALLLSVPLLLNLPSLQQQVERKVSEAAGGQITWDILYVRLLPRPRAVLRGVHAHFPDKLKLTLQDAEAFLRLSSLLRGRVEIGSVTLNHPVLELDLDTARASGKQAPAPYSDPITAYRAAMEPLVGIVRKFAPDSVWSIEAGSVNLRTPDWPQLELRELSLHARAGHNGFDLDVATASNFWNKLRLTARVEFADLAGHAEIEVSKLKPQPWLDYFAADVPAQVVLQTADLRMAARSDGKTSIEADINVTAPALGVVYGQRPLDIGAAHVQAKIIARAADTHLDITGLQLGGVLPSARAALSIDAEGQHPKMTVEVPTLDLALLRDAVIALAGDDPLIKAHAPRIRDGEIKQLSLSAQADSWAELSSMHEVQMKFMLERGAVLLPAVEQPAAGISASVEFADSILQVKSATAELGGSKLRDGAMSYALKDSAWSAGGAFDVQVAQAVALARKLLPQNQRAALKDLQSASGRISGTAHVASAQQEWNATIDVAKSDAQARFMPLPWPIAVRTLNVSASPRQITVSNLRGAIGSSTVDEAAMQLELAAEPRLLNATGRLTLVLSELYPWLRSQAKFAEPLRELTTVSGTSAVTLHSLSGSIERPAALRYDATIEPRQVAVSYEPLPGPVKIAGGAVRIDNDNVKLDHLGVSFLDAQTTLAGKITNYQGKRVQVNMSAADGAIGPQSMQWMWTRTGAPSHLMPKTPLQFEASRVLWGPERKLDAQFALRLEGGHNVAAELSWQPDALDVRRAVIRDERSNATLSFALKDRLMQAAIAGTLSVDSVAALFNEPLHYSGLIEGDMRVTLDLARQGRARADGHLSARALDLTGELAKPMLVDRLALEADGASLRIRETQVSYADQVVNISGEVKRGERGAIVNMQLDSPGIVLDALLPESENAEQGQAIETPEPAPGKRDEFFPRLWPLLVVGEIKLHSGFLQYQKYRIEPLSATMTLEEQRARIQLDEAKMCGISFPLALEVLPQHLSASVHILAQGQELGATTHCLTDQRVLISGRFDARADLTTSGKRGDLLRNLKGTMHAQAHDGRIMKSGLLGKILSVKSVTGLFGKGGPQFGSEGFTYRKLVTSAHFDDGKAFIDEAALDSNALGLAATGSIGLLDRQSKLTVLVAPFSSVDRIVRKVPIVGYIFGGLLTTVPVGVSGDIRDPLVVPLGPSAVTSQLTGVFTRTLEVPEKLLAPLSGGSQQKKP